MARKNGNRTKTAGQEKRKTGQVKGKQAVDATSAQWPEWIVRIYLVVMLGIFPLYYKNQLYEIGTVKFVFFRTATMVMLGLLAVELISSGRVVFLWKVWRTGGTEPADNGEQIRTGVKKRMVSGLSFTDMSVLVYMAVAILSWLFSPFRAETWTGSYQWYMGLVSQLLFVGIYFAVSRFCTTQRWPLWAMGGAGAIVFLLAYLHRFSIDPLGLYQNFSDHNRILFLGTIGQATIHSSYVCVVVPVMMGVYLYGGRQYRRADAVNGETDGQSGQRQGAEGSSEQKRIRGKKQHRDWSRPEHVLCGVVLFLGFGTAVTQNSDSVYVGLGLAFLFLLWFALEELGAWKRYVEIVLLAVSAAKITGILQTTFPERVPDLEPLSLWVTQSRTGWLVLTVLIVIYGLTWLAVWKNGRTGAYVRPGKKTGAGPIRVIRGLRAVFFGLLSLALLLLPVLIWLITTGKVTAISGVLGETGYFVFGWEWGNGRGRSWMYCARVFAEYNPFQKLFGCGPDVLTFYSEAFHADELRAMWGDLTLTNAHNEWLTALINFGVAGAAAYLSIFVSAVVRMIKNWRKQPFLLAAGAAVTAYFGHNFFCYQQMVCTPLIFIVLGAAEYLMRNIKRQPF